METDDQLVDRLLPMVRRAEGSADDAVSPKGAIGRYQIMPSTARALGYDPASLKDPNYNEQAARAAIRDLIKQHGHDDKAILAGYNASPAAVKRWKDNGRNDLVLPYETQNYFTRAGYVDHPMTPTYQPVNGPQGKQDYQKLLDGGFSKDEANNWAQGTAQKLRDGGFSEKEIAGYFDDVPYNIKPIEKLAKRQIDAVPPEDHEKVASNWQESLQAGFQTSVLGLTARQKMPDIQQPESGSLSLSDLITGRPKATFVQTLAFQGGQLAGDIPAMIAGGFAGLPFGGVGVFAGSAALPEAVRGALIDSYKNPNGHKTWREWADAYAEVAWNTAKAGLTGAVGGKAGSVAAGVVEKAGAGALAKSATFATSAAVASTGAGAALEGHVPNADDFLAGAALTVGLGLSGHIVGAARRYVPSKPVEVVADNMADLYKRTGIHPAEAQAAAKDDVVLKSEIVSRDADGTQHTPEFDSLKPDEPVFESPPPVKKVPEGEPQPEPVKPLAAEPDPATAPISEEKALAIRLKQVGEDEPKALEPAPEAPLPTGRFHGTSKEISQLTEGHYETLNYYGQGFYTTDAYKIAQGYSKKGRGQQPTIYHVSEKNPVNFYDMEKPIVPELRSYLEKRLEDKYAGTHEDVIGQALDENPKNLREFYDSVREIATGEGLSADEVQEGIFQPISYTLEEMGYGGLRHIGGLRTKKEPHDVKIYFNPEKDVVISKISPPGKVPSVVSPIGGKPPGGKGPPPPEIEGEFREIPPRKLIGEEMPLGTAEKIMDSFIGEKPDKPRPWWNPITMYRGYITELAQSRVLDKALDSDPKKAGIEDMTRQVYGSKGRTGYFVRYGTVKLGRDAKTGDVTYNETQGKSMFAAFELARQNGGTEDGLVRYWISSRALQLANRGITSGANTTAARRIVQDTWQTYHPALKMLQENNFAVVDYVRDSGVFSSKRAQAMKDLNPFHIVFQRVVDPAYNPVGRGFGPRQPVKTIEGSDRKIVPPIPAQVDNMHTMIAMADRNLAVGKLLDAYTKKVFLDPNFAKAIEFKDRLDPKTLIEDYNKMPLVDRVDEEGNPISPKDAEALIPMLAQKAFFSKRGPNDFLYFNKGVPEIYTAKDPETALLFRAAQPQGEAHAALKIAEGFANISRLGIVSLPEFPLRTGIRSQFEAAVRSEYVGIPGHAWLQGAWHAFGQTEKFQQFMKDGGFAASVVDIDEKYIQRDVSALFEKTGTWNRIWNVATHPLEALHKYRAMIENAGRMGAWMQGQEAGLSGGKAAMESRKAFGDNAEKAGLQIMNSWAKITMFMRPSILDVAYFAQAMRDRPARTIASGAALITLPTIANFIANKMYDADKENNPQYRADHPEYQSYSEIARWQKDMMMVLPPINGVRMRLPTVPYTSGFVFHTLAERFLSYAYDKDPRAFREWGQTFMAQFMPPIIPALALPIYEATFNIRQGSGAPLIPASLERASPEMMYNRNTSETAKTVSHYLGKIGIDQSPIALDNYVREWTGPIPSQVIRAMDGSMKADNRPWQMADVPMIGAFLARHPDMNSQPIEDFFAQMKIFEQKHADIALAIKNQDFSVLPRTLQDPRGLMKMTQMVKVAQAIQNQANVLRVMDTSKMTNAEKQKYMDAGYSQMVQQAKVSLQVLDSVPQEFK